MKRRVLISFLLALFFHLALILPFWITIPSIPKEPPEPKRFDILFSEESSIDDATPISSVPSVPGSAHSVSQDDIPTKQSEQTTQESEPTILPLPPQTPYLPADRESLPRSVLHHYGEEFFDLTPGEQHYILDNLQRIRKINEIVGTRLLRERPDDEIDPDDSNVVEFSLHPDGTISHLRLQKNRVGTLLDELTLQTITLAHERYPKPDQTTLIKIRVYIVIH